MIRKKKQSVLGLHFLTALIRRIVDRRRSRTSETVFKGDGGWYFWNETWTEADGPYRNKRAASTAQMTYARNNGLL